MQDRREKAFLGLSGITHGDCKKSGHGKWVVYCGCSRKEEWQGVVRDETEEANRVQVIQGFVSQDKKFDFCPEDS